MHELALAEEVSRIVEDAAAARGATEVGRIVLEIGQLAMVEVDALNFCLASVLRDGCARRARIDVELVPGRGRCGACGSEAALAQRYDPCPACGAHALEPTAGTCMRVREIELILP